MARKTTPKPPAPTPIRPDFARERANILWRSYHSVVEAIEKKQAKKVLTTPTRPGRVLKAGEAKLRYEQQLAGEAVTPAKPRTPPKVAPSAYTKRQAGIEKYTSPTKGDPDLS